MCIDRDQVNEWISPFIAGAKRSPQPGSWLGQRHFINCIARFFSICSHSWDSVVLPTNMHGMWMVSFFHGAAKSAFLTMLLRIAACAEVRERRRGARRKARVRKEWVELNTTDFSLSLYKSSKLNTCSPLLSLFSRLVFSIPSMFIHLPRL